MNQVLFYHSFISEKKRGDEKGSGALQIYFQAQSRIEVLPLFPLKHIYSVSIFALFRELKEYSNSDLTGVKVKDFIKEVIYPK